MRRPRRWLAASAAVLVLAGSGIAVRGVDLGVEFTGGRLIEYSTATPVDPDRARAALADAGFPRVVVQSSDEEQLTLRTGRLTDPEEARVTDTVRNLGGTADKVGDHMVGPSLGKELRQAALSALVLALGAQLLYLAARFRWVFGTAAVTALAHDVIVLVGVFAWLGKPIDGVFVAALLTVIGYSGNNSVVVFDRIRERWRSGAGASFAQLTNRAILQTLPRTLNTGLGAAFIRTALAVLGGEALGDFALALLVGLVIGTYSSVFTAAPVALELQAHISSTPRRK